MPLSELHATSYLEKCFQFKNSTCEKSGVGVFWMHEHSNARDPQAEDGVVHLELPPRHGSHEVGAVLPAAAEQNLQEQKKNCK